MVTIGIPCYNEEKYIARTLDSILAAQGISRIIISDNASTDKTSQICMDYAAKYPKVEYTQQKTNLGMLPNWKYLMQKTQTPYFCLVGAHDTIPENYITLLKPMLERYPEAVLAFGYVKISDGLGNFQEDYYYDHFASLLTDPSIPKRIHGFLTHIYNCSLVDGLWRTDVLRESFYEHVCLGPDIVTMARALEHGIFVYNREIYFGRNLPNKDETPVEQALRFQTTLNTSKREIPRGWREICEERLAQIPGGKDFCRKDTRTFLQKVISKTKFLMKKFILK